MQKSFTFAFAMRYLHLTLGAAVLLSTGWAQARRKPLNELLVKPTPEKVAKIRNMMQQKGIQHVLIPLSPEELYGVVPSTPSSSSHLRTTSNVLGLTWLRLHQDADTVPTTNNTNPFVGGQATAGFVVAGDTLIGSGAASDLNPNNSSACDYTFFDSLGAKGAYLGGYISDGSGGIPNGAFVYLTGSILDNWATDADTAYYHGGGAAQRYWFDFTGLNDLYIQGVGVWVLKNRYLGGGTDMNRCVIQTPTFPDWDGNSTPEAVFFVARADTATYGSSFGLGTYVSNILASDTVPYSELRLGSLNSATGQCVQPQIDPTDAASPYFGKWHYRLFERLHYVKFSTPVRVGPNQVFGSNSNPDSMYYVGFLWERPEDPTSPPTGGWLDTLFTGIGPFGYLASGDCLHDTLYYLNLGRTMRVFGEYNTADGSWQAVYFLPERTMWRDREGYLLDFPIFPIIATGLPTTSASKPVVHHGAESFSLPYPNPATDCVKLTATVPAATSVDFLVYDVSGRMVHAAERKVSAGTHELSVDVGHLQAGSYLLVVRTGLGGMASYWINILR